MKTKSCRKAPERGCKKIKTTNGPKLQTRITKAKVKKKVADNIGKQKTTSKRTSSKTVKSNLETKKAHTVNDNVCSNPNMVVLDTPKPRKPPKFSWIEEGLLAGQARPTKHGHMQFLCDHGFKYLITLTVNKPRAIAEYPGPGLEWVHIPIYDERPPTMEQVDNLMSVVEKAKKEKKAVAVHCAWGRGRTGTMMACYLVRYRKLSAAAAIKQLRVMRPGSIDTETQADVVSQYAKHIKKIKK